jgi:uncharacterized membrane protein
MNKKAIQWLYQELPDLVSKVVLTQEAADKLRNHYGEIKSVNKNWFFIILFGVIGALLIGLGIISLIGHNWEELSRPVRVVLSLLPLVSGQALALWVLLKRPASHAFKEGTATFLSLMVGASMALISQTYNIPGDTADFIFTWMLLIVPLVYFMEATITAAIYVAGVTVWAGHFWNSPLQAFLIWPLLAVVVPHFIWALRQEKYAIRAAILALVMAISVCLAAGFSLGKTWPGSWIVIYSSIIALFYLLGSWEFRSVSTNWQKPFRILGGLGVFSMIFSLTFRFPWESVTGKYHYLKNETFSWIVLPDCVLTVFLAVAAIVMFLEYVKRNDLRRALFGALPLVALVGYAFSGIAVFFSMVLFNIYLFVVSLVWLRSGIQTKSLGVINAGMFMLAALIIARFFDSEINFILKGLVFIAIGIGFLVTNIVILRGKGGES